MTLETGKCSICGDLYEHFGNNPEPVKKVDERCCDACNWEIVVPIRMGRRPLFLGTWATQKERQEQSQALWEQVTRENPEQFEGGRDRL